MHRGLLRSAAGRCRTGRKKKKKSTHGINFGALAPRCHIKGKGKGFTLEQATKPQRGSSSTLSLTSALDGVGGQRLAPAALPPVKRAGSHCTGGWVGPRAGLDECGKSRPPPGFDPRTVQAVASRYTDWAIAAHSDVTLYRKTVRTERQNDIPELRSSGSLHSV